MENNNQAWILGLRGNLFRTLWNIPTKYGIIQMGNSYKWGVYVKFTFINILTDKKMFCGIDERCES